jgi:hypothetical protein
MRAIYSAEQDQTFFLKAFSTFGKTDSYSTIRLIELLQIDISDAWRLLLDWEQAGYICQVTSETSVHSRYREWSFTARAEGATRQVFLTNPSQARPQRA